MSDRQNNGSTCDRKEGRKRDRKLSFSVCVVPPTHRVGKEEKIIIMASELKENKTAYNRPVSVCGIRQCIAPDTQCGTPTNESDEAKGFCKEESREGKHGSACVVVPKRKLHKIFHTEWNEMKG